MSEQSTSSTTAVRHFRQILLWPLQLMPIRPGTQIQELWGLLDQEMAENQWRELLDEFTPDGKEFQLHHYSEFVTFLPYVQRFIYRESRLESEGALQPIDRRRRSAVTQTADDGGNGSLGRHHNLSTLR